MKNKRYSSSQEDVWSLPDEYRTAEEICAPPKEYTSPSEYPPSDENEEYPPISSDTDGNDREKVKSHTKKAMMFTKTAAIVAAVTVVFASYGADYLKKPSDVNGYIGAESEFSSPDSSNPSSNSKPVTESSDTESEFPSSDSSDLPDDDPNTEKADAVFPELSNLEPNGETNTQYGVLNEEFICINHPSTGTTDFILTNPADTYNTEVNIDGITYDKATNTLTLDNYSGDRLVVNLMGNGFKLKLVGENSLQQIVVWGFHYGGSLTITGEGSLTVNKDNTESIGIFFESESSQTCLMIDKNVTLDIYGTDSAVFVKETTMEKSVYYLSPLILTGGVRKSESENDIFYGYIEDENGDFAKHVTFSRDDR